MADPSVDDLLTFYSGRVIFKSPSPARRLGAAEKWQRGGNLQRGGKFAAGSRRSVGQEPISPSVKGETNSTRSLAMCGGASFDCKMKVKQPRRLKPTAFWNKIRVGENRPQTSSVVVEKKLPFTNIPPFLFLSPLALPERRRREVTLNKS